MSNYPFKRVNHFYIFDLGRGPNFMDLNFLNPLTRYKKVHAYPHNFSVSLFSSSDIHQSQCLDRCQATGINSFLICAFWALHFFWPSYHSIRLSLYHGYTCCITKQSGTCYNKYRRRSTALSHISCVLRWPGTCYRCHGLSSTAFSHISCVLKGSGTRKNMLGFHPLPRYTFFASCTHQG